jgi:hypothetical protein
MASSQSLNSDSVFHWRELLDAGLPANLKAAVKSAIRSYEAGLPPRTGRPKREIKRLLYAIRNSMRALRMTV